ncbi:hypothetical protein [Ruegeria lacuscaerulensis]|uniref:hypothetical protein n=1 Tax=Ruegeria lacuscaerulensis TaxID=55218 RepID=UPI001BE4D748|nr:hypothetical protein [Ruegeria lacuscaerulensis]
MAVISKSHGQIVGSNAKKWVKVAPLQFGLRLDAVVGRVLARQFTSERAADLRHSDLVAVSC